MEANTGKGGDDLFDPMELSALIEEMGQNIPQSIEKPLKKE
jgi:hypothetical protein